MAKLDFTPTQHLDAPPLTTEQVTALRAIFKPYLKPATTTTAARMPRPRTTVRRAA